MKRFFYPMAVLTICFFTACSNSDDDADDEIYTGHTVTLRYSDYREYGYFDGLLYYEITTDGNIEVSKAVESIVTADIPSIVILDDDKYICKSIGSSAFKDCTQLKSVTIPNSITLISNSAFENCKSLPTLTIPDCVTVIGQGAFYGCSGLTAITIPNSITEIIEGVFRDCSGLTSITIPNSITNIGGCAFRGCI